MLPTHTDLDGFQGISDLRQAPIEVIAISNLGGEAQCMAVGVLASRGDVELPFACLGITGTAPRLAGARRSTGWRVRFLPSQTRIKFVEDDT